jgi:hypothetical protein
MDFVKLIMSNFQFSILNHIIANFVHIARAEGKMFFVVTTHQLGTI